MIDLFARAAETRCERLSRDIDAVDHLIQGIVYQTNFFNGQHERHPTGFD